MRNFKGTNAFSVFVFIFAYFSFICDAQPVTVSTRVGVIEGFQDSVMADGQVKILTKFLGIPYAESTAGKERFRKAVPKAPFNTTFYAKTYSPSCFQSLAILNYTVDPNSFTEDCLFLNIFVPNNFKSNASLPVMVWVHGGGFVGGTASIYTGDVLSTFGNVVLVTINYRVEMFGFLRSADGQLVGNQGLWDQQLAIQWVHQNIDSFHGNPDEVTIFGQSAGAQSVLFQALYPGNKGMFKRVIAESGTSLRPWPVDSIPNAAEFIEKIGCSRGPVDPYTCIRSKTAVELQNITVKYSPYVDGDFVIEHPYAIVYGNNPKSAAAREFFASLDILLGANDVDGAIYLVSAWPAALNATDFNDMNLTKDRFDNIIVPAVIERVIQPKDNKLKEILKSAVIFEYTDWSAPDDVNKLRQSLVDLSTDIIQRMWLIQTARGHSNLNEGKLNQGSTYMYEFGLTPSHHVIPTPTWVTGSNHADELPFVFGNNVSSLTPIVNVTSPINFTKEEAVVARAVMTMWTNFAKSSNPNTPEDITQYIQTTWPEYNSVSQKYMKFTNRLSSASVEERFYPERMAFWLELIPSLVNATHQQSSLHFDPSTGLVG